MNIPFTPSQFFGIIENYNEAVFPTQILQVLTYFIESTRHTTIVMGLPCPTTILTFGLLLIAGKTLPTYLLIIPFLWALVGTTATFKFGVIPDYMLILAAVITVILRFIKKRQKEAGVGEQTIDYKSST
ncbi:MAG: hypothetical protein EOM90_13120 [Alphaproteobacteria bacterium]|nr:hypothetical protein [Alphaproteobacteria bacterium]